MARLDCLVTISTLLTNREYLLFELCLEQEHRKQLSYCVPLRKMFSENFIVEPYLLTGTKIRCQVHNAHGRFGN